MKCYPVECYAMEPRRYLSLTADTVLQGATSSYSQYALGILPEYLTALLHTNWPSWLLSLGLPCRPRGVTIHTHLAWHSPSFLMSPPTELFLSLLRDEETHWLWPAAGTESEGLQYWNAGSIAGVNAGGNWDCHLLRGALGKLLNFDESSSCH